MEVPESGRADSSPVRTHYRLSFFLVALKFIGVIVGVVAIVLFFGIVVGIPN
jgi:hypothetical protein